MSYLVYDILSTSSVTFYNVHSVTSNAVAEYASKVIKYKSVTVDSITIGSDGYADIRSYFPSGMNNFMFCLLWSWGGNTAKAPIAVETDGYWLWGQVGAVCPNVVVRYYYTD